VFWKKPQAQEEEKKKKRSTGDVYPSADTRCAPCTWLATFGVVECGLAAGAFGWSIWLDIRAWETTISVKTKAVENQPSSCKEEIT
jgi:hypothetical protein